MILLPFPEEPTLFSSYTAWWHSKLYSSTLGILYFLEQTPKVLPDSRDLVSKQKQGWQYALRMYSRNRYGPIHFIILLYTTMSCHHTPIISIWRPGVYYVTVRCNLQLVFTKADIYLKAALRKHSTQQIVSCFFLYHWRPRRSLAHVKGHDSVHIKLEINSWP